MLVIDLGGDILSDTEKEDLVIWMAENLTVTVYSIQDIDMTIEEE